MFNAIMSRARNEYSLRPYQHFLAALFACVAIGAFGLSFTHCEQDTECYDDGRGHCRYGYGLDGYGFGLIALAVVSGFAGIISFGSAGNAPKGNGSSDIFAWHLKRCLKRRRLKNGFGLEVVRLNEAIVRAEAKKDAERRFRGVICSEPYDGQSTETQITQIDANIAQIDAELIDLREKLVAAKERDYAEQQLVNGYRKVVDDLKWTVSSLCTESRGSDSWQQSSVRFEAAIGPVIVWINTDTKTD